MYFVETIVILEQLTKEFFNLSMVGIPGKYQNDSRAHILEKNC